MKVLGATQVDKWFQQYETLGNGIDYVHGDKDGLFYIHPESDCIQLEYPPKLERLPFFARCLATVGYEEHDFDGALIWLSSWGIWNSREEGIGYGILERMNAGAGQPRAFEASAGYHFRGDELRDAIGLLLQPMVFAWDAFYSPTWSYGTGEFFLHISHHSCVDIVTRTKVFHDRVFEQLGKLNLNPTRVPEARTNRFCRGR